MLRLFGVVLSLIIAIPCTSIANDDFWKIKNIDAPRSRVGEVKTALEKCQDGLKPYFDRKPSPLTVYLYGKRSTFVKGLQNIHGFSKEGAAYFEKSSAPRPIRGNYLTPPDQDLRNVCHEVVHHYLENNTNRENLLNAKWFDEGTASLLAQIIFGPEKLKGMRNYVLKTSGGNFIPIEEMQSEEEWSRLHRRKEWRSISYLQAMFMVDYFFNQYSIDDFKRLLAAMNHKSFDDSFQAVTKTSQKRFYKSWKKNFIKNK